MVRFSTKFYSLDQGQESHQNSIASGDHTQLKFGNLDSEGLTKTGPSPSTNQQEKNLERKKQNFRKIQKTQKGKKSPIFYFCSFFDIFC